MESTSKRLDRWLREQAFGDYGSLTRISVRHAKQSGKGGVVGNIKPEKLTLDDIKELCHSLMSMVQDYATGLGGHQRFILESYHDEGEAPTASFSCRVYGVEEDSDDSPDDTEPATKAGLLAQNMRHAETYMKTLVHGTGGIINSLYRVCDRQAQQIDMLMEKQFQMLGVMEEALTKKHDRDMEMIQLSSDIERKDKLMERGIDGAKTLIPVIINRMAGRKMLPEPDAEALMLGGFIETLTPEQFKGILAALDDPDMQEMFIETVSNHQEKKKLDVARVKSAFMNLKPEQVHGILSILTPEQQIVLIELAGKGRKNVSGRANGTAASEKE